VSGAREHTPTLSPVVLLLWLKEQLTFMLSLQLTMLNRQLVLLVIMVLAAEPQPNSEVGLVTLEMLKYYLFMFQVILLVV